MGTSDGSGGAPVTDTMRVPIREGESDGATNELYSHEMETIPITEDRQVSLFGKFLINLVTKTKKKAVYFS